MTTKVVVNDYFLTLKDDIIFMLAGGKIMTNLKNNIDHYMDRKGIRFYSDLLVDIAHQLGIKGKEAYAFADREKANFSKMLKGERPLKYEFIIPLERIFGVSLARLLDEEAYKLPVDKNYVPFEKGMRYYAYMDDYDLYEKELDMFLTKESKSCLSGMDEFEKTFLDYVVEYGSKNAVRFLRDKYGIKMKFYNNQFEASLQNSFIIFSHHGIEFARLVASINDPKLFNNIYDSYYMMASNGFYTSNTIWVQDDFQEIIMDNKLIFESLFEKRGYDFPLTKKAKAKYNKDGLTFSSINPIINCCLRYALKHLPKYKNQAIEILKYGIQHNKRVIEGLPFEINRAYVDECGGLKNISDHTYEIYDVVVVVDVNDIQDKEINELIQQLPTFHNPF